MFDFVFSLRTLLLIIGALIVGGIYLWGGKKSRRNTNIKYSPRRARFEPTRRRAGSQGATIISRDIDTEVLEHVDSDSQPPPAIIDEVVATDEAPIVDLPTITRDDDLPPQTQKKNTGQLELTFDTEAIGEHASADPADKSPDQEVIIPLYVRAPDGHEFAGPAIVRSMNSVGLRFGDMDIFHHFGAGDLRTDLPIFSVANMLEPGYFDLQDIDSLATPGLAMFLRLPGPLDGAVAFELFLNTAQRLAEALSGDLYGDPKKLLDSTAIDKMRQLAAPFTNAN